MNIHMFTYRKETGSMGAGMTQRRTANDNKRHTLIPRHLNEKYKKSCFFFTKTNVDLKRFKRETM